MIDQLKDILAIILSDHKTIGDALFVLTAGIVSVLKILSKRKDLPEILRK